MTGRASPPAVAIAVGATSSDRDTDTPLLVRSLERAGVAARPLAWDDPRADWDEYDLVVIRSTWDYVSRLGEFLAWADSVPRLANPADVVRWNTDKSYLRDLDRAGVPVVPTRWVAPGDPVELPEGDVVVKPAVGNGSRESARFRAGDDAARAHVARLHARGSVAMVQPYLDSIDERAETGVVVIGNHPSHAIAKPQQLARSTMTRRDTGIATRRPCLEELELAARALAQVPGGPDRLLYARVDMVAGGTGAPVIMELEVAEPSLFLALSDGAADRLAAAVVGAITAR
ncbi:MAG TPA: hypothetical protein VND23_01130 [Acidimicrobiales bacterium]|nr:hypothetical protein [Acidimicrobiales bacterium]